MQSTTAVDSQRLVCLIGKAVRFALIVLPSGLTRTDEIIRNSLERGSQE
jgi:hypothetical protein